GGGSFFSGILAVAKKVQGALPIVGLMSRLANPEGGGFDELAYPEFCRAMINNAPLSFRIAQGELEKVYGKPANSRWVLLILFFTKTGVGIVPTKEIISSARRLRVTQDIEIEVERFEQSKATVLKKYEMVARPEGKLVDRLAVTVDALCMLCIGLKEGEPVPDVAAPFLQDIIVATFPEADPALIAFAISSKAERGAAYV
ncbi:hypothetical protein TSOC_000663, partial [Tetrabaena socialis]